MQYFIDSQITGNAFLRIDGNSSLLSYSIDGKNWSPVVFNGGTTIIQGNGDSISVVSGTGISISNGTVSVNFASVQGKLTSGNCIEIAGNTVNAKYTGRSGVNISSGTVTLNTGDKVFGGTSSLAEDHAALLGKQERLTAVNGISLTQGGTISVDFSAVQKKLTQGTGINIGSDGTISATVTGNTVSFVGGTGIALSGNTVSVKTGDGIYIDGDGALTSAVAPTTIQNVSGTYYVDSDDGLSQCLVLSGNTDIRLATIGYTSPIDLEIHSPDDYVIKIFGNTVTKLRGIYMTALLIVDGIACAYPVTSMSYEVQ